MSNPMPNCMSNDTPLLKHQGKKRLFLGVASAAMLALSMTACSNSTPTARSGQTAAAAGQSSLYGLAQSAADRGDHSAAVPLYRAAMAQDSNLATQMGLSRSLMALGQHVEAERVMRQAVDSHGDNPDAQAGLGTVLLALGQPEAAAPLFDAAIARAPRHGEALRGQALSADLTGRHADALAVYQRALDGGDADVRLRNNYGLSLALHDDAAAGAAVLERLVRERAGGVAVRQNLALAYVFTGDLEKARSLLLVDMDPNRVNQQLDTYQTLKGMRPSGRLQALMTGAKPEPRDATALAVETHGDGPIQHDVALAAVGVETQPLGEPTVLAEAPAEQEPAPVPEVQPQPETVAGPVAPADQADADLSHIPMLEQNGWALQLAAYRKASQLVAGWEQLRAANQEIIGHLPPRRTEIDFGSRESSPTGFYYRLNAGPLTERADAERLCAQLRERGTECWVRPPEQGEGRLPEAKSATEAPTGLETGTGHSSLPQPASDQEPS